MTGGELLKETRARHGLSQSRLALRAGTGQAAISRIERNQVSPSVETLSHLLAAMGEQLELGAHPSRRDYDPVHLRALRRRAPAERLQLAIAWNRLASQLTRAGRQARGE